LYIRDWSFDESCLENLLLPALELMDVRATRTCTPAGLIAMFERDLYSGNQWKNRIQLLTPWQNYETCDGKKENPEQAEVYDNLKDLVSLDFDVALLRCGRTCDELLCPCCSEDCENCGGTRCSECSDGECRGCQEKVCIRCQDTKITCVRCCEDTQEAREAASQPIDSDQDDDDDAMIELEDV
jgi:hypothetical protein